MAITLEQHTKLQPRIVEVQRLALEFAELGEMKVSRLLLQAGMTAARIKPTKPEQEAQPKKAAAK
jgi:hypothetical protein